MNIQEKIVLAPYATLRVGGPADFFVAVQSILEAVEALHFARQKGLRVFFLGGGSNLLFSDQGFRGLVIKNEIRKIEVRGDKIWAAGGTPLSELVNVTAQQHLAGLEDLAGVPGTLGGAVVGNANNIGKLVSFALTLTKLGEEKNYARGALEFGYRDSAFKKSQELLVEVELALQKVDFDLENALRVKAQEKVAKQPYRGTAGSWFKNPEGQRAWELIDAAGMRGVRIGDAVVSEQHANFFQNLGQAKTADFLVLERKVIDAVRKKFGVELEREVVYVS